MSNPVVYRRFPFPLDPVGLEVTAENIMVYDGDRGPSAPSRLTCDQTLSIANFLRALARDVRRFNAPE